jgi:putative SOS response-associated peptidase YedK
MCGRYTNDAEFSEIRLAFKADPFERLGAWQPTYNINPTYGAGFEQLIVVAGRGGRQIRSARWWLIPPFWKKPLKSLPTAFNARLEDLASKPFWRESLRSKRCIIPSTGWREFKGERGKKQPYHFRLPSGVFGFAGLWSTWTSAEGEVVDSFAIITSRPNDAAAQIHDRMPLVLSPESYGAWLDPGVDPTSVLEAAQVANDTLQLEIYPSDPIGNNGRFEGPEVIARVASPEPASSLPAQQELFGGTETAVKRR